MTDVTARLAELGIELGAPATPLADYVPAVRSGPWVFTAGQLPLRDGALLARGVVGVDVPPSVAAECARQCALNALAAVTTQVDLSAVRRVVTLVGYVACAPGFTGQPAVLDGASRLFGEVFGERGRHARSAVGVAALPLGAPVEVEVVVEVEAETRV